MTEIYDCIKNRLALVGYAKHQVHKIRNKSMLNSSYNFYLITKS